MKDDEAGCSLRDVLGSFLDRLERRFCTCDAGRPVPWGYVDAKAMLRRSGPGGLIVVSAPPCFDEESAALRLVHHVGVVLGDPVLVLSVGGRPVEFAERLIALESGVRDWRLHCGILSDGDWTAVGNAVSQLAESPVQIDGIDFDEPWEVADRIKQFNDSSGIGSVVLDSFGSLAEESTRYEPLGRITDLNSMMKNVATDLKVPLIVLRPNDRWFSHEEAVSLSAEEYDISW